MISVCIITKNESENLKKCLSLLSSYNFEIVVVDTGSDDNSKAVASAYTKNVYDFPWCNDFAQARNFSISKATNDNILVLDTDEFITELDYSRLEQSIINNPHSIGRIHRRNYYTSMGNEMIFDELIGRLFNRKYYEYNGKIHEQLVAFDNSNPVFFEAPLHINHTGYVGDITAREKKADRNISILKDMLKDSPSDTYLLYQLGKSFYYKEDYENAAKSFEKILPLSFDYKSEYIRDMIITYGYSLINSNQAKKALSLIDCKSFYKDNADFIFMLGLVYMQNELFAEAVDHFLSATSLTDCNVAGTNSYLALYNAGVIYECLGYPEDAKTLYLECGNYKKAIEGIKRLNI